jgi:PBP1b-binding outer membrane lipoprotein LpoB
MKRLIVLLLLTMLVVSCSPYKEFHNPAKAKLVHCKF